MNQLTELAIEIQKLSERLPEASNSMAKTATRAIIQDLVLHTPVDVGTALSNWQVTLNAPSGNIIPPFSPSLKGRTVKGEWQHTIPPDVTREANVSAILFAAELIIESKQPGQDIYISNNVPYIGILDQGSSEQAPAGFVDRARVLAQTVLDAGLKLG
jgi:hypothetical protein